VTVVSGERQQSRMEADGLAMAFQNSAPQIIVKQNSWYTAPGGEGGEVAAQEVFHASIEEEAQEDLARVTQHHDKCHQRTPRPADLQMAEVPPVTLCLLGGQAGEAQIGLGRAAWPVAGDKMAEMIRPAAIAALAHHRIQPAGGQCGELLE